MESRERKFINLLTIHIVLCYAGVPGEEDEKLSLPGK